MNTAQGRGQLTNRVKIKAKELLGYNIDQTELRLMPYFNYVMINSQHMESNKLNINDRAILSKWRKAGHITGGVSESVLMTCTPDFWANINELLYLAYVDIKQ